ncbi:helix-turn-helix domain-containing protein [Altericroceibacterium endophyticum]|uniref:Helix-turn-helix domain-containing protein n=1 Tax=Altericroceibacterium endophyticum TaxID=1808508 RepID=A0A6I4TAB7_9SPHN|nr:AraC family transcriptional regulator [Altericroceibacterium endophyticum]MXO66695.1 helix-turn-helix domain-containing protein [Altericroceibacterium endophyticum]
MVGERPQSAVSARGWSTDYAIYPSAKYSGAPPRPILLGANSSGVDGVQLLDWIVPDRVEVVSEGARSCKPIGERSSKFCIYMADRTTWVGRDRGDLRQAPPHRVVVINTDEPIITVSPEDTRHLTLVLPGWLVCRHAPIPEQLVFFQQPAEHVNFAAAREIMLALRACLDISQFSSVSSDLVAGLLKTLSGSGHVSLPHATRHSLSTRMELVKRTIAENYSDPDFGTEELAKILCVSPRHLATICAGVDSPGKLIRTFRLEQALALLRSPPWRDRSITDIAFACGFNSSSHFSTAFRHYVGCSPRQCRAQAEQHGNSQLLC